MAHENDIELIIKAVPEFVTQGCDPPKETDIKFVKFKNDGKNVSLIIGTREFSFTKEDIFRILKFIQ